MQKEYEIELDLYDDYEKRAGISYTSGDSETMLFNIKLLKNNKPFELLTSDLVELVFQNPLGGGCASYADIVEHKNGVVAYAPISCQTSVDGENIVRVVVTRGTKRLTWHGFKFDVKGGNYLLCANTAGETAIDIGENGNWWFGETDSGISAEGKDGKDGADGQNGLTPIIGANGNWWIGGTDSGVSATGCGADGKDGVDGKDGKSAYELALDSGFTGTEADWLESLKGTDGLDGKDGIDGKDGENAEIAIGEVTTVEPGEPAEVINTGTSTNAVLDFKIPRGRDADEGESLFTSEELERIHAKLAWGTPETGVEYWTGDYWIDGRKIYGMVVNTGEVPNNTTKTVPLGVNNTDHHITLTAFGKDSRDSPGGFNVLLPWMTGRNYSNGIGLAFKGANTSTGQNSIYIDAGNGQTMFTSSYAVVTYVCLNR